VEGILTLIDMLVKDQILPWLRDLHTIDSRKKNRDDVTQAVEAVRYSLSVLSAISKIQKESLDGARLAKSEAKALRKIKGILEKRDGSLRLKGISDYVRNGHNEHAGKYIDDLVLLSLLDPNPEIRRYFANVIAGLVLRRVALEIPADVLLDHLRNPLQSFEFLEQGPLMPKGISFDPWLARRKKRYALLWSLHLIFKLDPKTRSTSQKYLDESKAMIRETLERQADAWTESRELHLMNLIETLGPDAVLGLDEEREFKLGSDQAFSLLDVLRLVSLRDQIRSYPDDWDWLLTSAKAIVPPDSKTKASQIIHAPISKEHSRRDKGQTLQSGARLATIDSQDSLYKIEITKQGKLDVVMIGTREVLQHNLEFEPDNVVPIPEISDRVKPTVTFSSDKSKIIIQWTITPPTGSEYLTRTDIYDVYTEERVHQIIETLTKEELKSRVLDYIEPDERNHVWIEKAVELTRSLIQIDENSPYDGKDGCHGCVILLHDILTAMGIDSEIVGLDFQWLVPGWRGLHYAVRTKDTIYADAFPEAITPKGQDITGERLVLYPGTDIRKKYESADGHARRKERELLEPRYLKVRYPESAQLKSLYADKIGELAKSYHAEKIREFKEVTLDLLIQTQSREFEGNPEFKEVTLDLLIQIQRREFKGNPYKSWRRLSRMIQYVQNRSRLTFLERIQIYRELHEALEEGASHGWSIFLFLDEIRNQDIRYSVQKTTDELVEELINAYSVYAENSGEFDISHLMELFRHDLKNAMTPVQIYFGQLLQSRYREIMGEDWDDVLEALLKELNHSYANYIQAFESVLYTTDAFLGPGAMDHFYKTQSPDEDAKESLHRFYAAVINTPREFFSDEVLGIVSEYKGKFEAMSEAVEEHKFEIPENQGARLAKPEREKLVRDPDEPSKKFIVKGGLVIEIQSLDEVNDDTRFRSFIELVRWRYENEMKLDPESIDSSIDEIRKRLPESSRNEWVAFNGNEALAYQRVLVSQKQPEHAIEVTLYVSESFRHRSIGRLLREYVLFAIKNRGIQTTGSTVDSSEESLRFHESMIQRQPQAVRNIQRDEQGTLESYTLDLDKHRFTPPKSGLQFNPETQEFKLLATALFLGQGYNDLAISTMNHSGPVFSGTHMHLLKHMLSVTNLDDKDDLIAYILQEGLSVSSESLRGAVRLARKYAGWKKGREYKRTKRQIEHAINWHKERDSSSGARLAKKKGSDDYKYLDDLLEPIYDQVFREMIDQGKRTVTPDENRGEHFEWGLYLQTKSSYLKYFKEIFGISKNDHAKIVDMGSGRGRLALMLAIEYPNIDIVGIERSQQLFDESQRALELAVEKGLIREGKVLFFPGDFNKKKFHPYLREANFIYYFGKGTNDIKSLSRTLVETLKAGAQFMHRSLFNKIEKETLETELVESGLFLVQGEDHQTAPRIFTRRTPVESDGARLAETKSLTPDKTTFFAEALKALRPVTDKRLALSGEVFHISPIGITGDYTITLFGSLTTDINPREVLESLKGLKRFTRRESDAFLEEIFSLEDLFNEDRESFEALIKIAQQLNLKTAPINIRINLDDLLSRLDEESKKKALKFLKDAFQKAKEHKLAHIQFTEDKYGFKSDPILENALTVELKELNNKDSSNASYTIPYLYQNKNDFIPLLSTLAVSNWIGNLHHNSVQKSDVLEFFKRLTQNRHIPDNWLTLLQTHTVSSDIAIKPFSYKDYLNFMIYLQRLIRQTTDTAA